MDDSDTEEEEDHIVTFKKIDFRAANPSYSSAGAGGIDIAPIHSATICPQEAIVMDTGLAFQLPPETSGVIKARSSLAIAGMSIEGGVIDSDYRGEIKLIVRNQNKYSELAIKGGDRIAQMLIIDTPRYKIWETHQLNKTQRGDKGFGSTGSTSAFTKVISTH